MRIITLQAEDEEIANHIEVFYKGEKLKGVVSIDVILKCLLDR